jgi:hypothetical protein
MLHVFDTRSRNVEWKGTWWKFDGLFCVSSTERRGVNTHNNKANCQTDVRTNVSTIWPLLMHYTAFCSPSSCVFLPSFGRKRSKRRELVENVKRRVRTCVYRVQHAASRSSGEVPTRSWQVSSERPGTCLDTREAGEYMLLSPRGRKVIMITAALEDYCFRMEEIEMLRCLNAYYTGA